MPSKKHKIIYIDDEEYVWCSHEKEYISCSEFETNENGRYKQFCIKCSELIYEDRNMNYSMGAQERNKYVEEQSKLILRNLGYETNGQYSIHEQFLIKHNLI